MLEQKYILKTDNLVIGYKGSNVQEKIFGPVNIQFTESVFVGVVAANGVGKSTLLKTIAGVLPPLAGDVLIEKQSVRLFTQAQLASKISIVPTGRVGGFNIRTRDLVGMGRLPYTDMFNRISAVDEEIIQQCIQACGVGKEQHKLLYELSDGNYQKAAIAMGLAQKTPIMLLDEPTAFLDYGAKHQIMELLKNITGSEKKCILTASHDIDLLLHYTDTILFMKRDGAYSVLPSRECRASDFIS